MQGAKISKKNHNDNNCNHNHDYITKAEMMKENAEGRGRTLHIILHRRKYVTPHHINDERDKICNMNKTQFARIFKDLEIAEM